VSASFVSERIAEHQAAVAALGESAPAIAAAGDRLVATLRAGGRILLCGNGGSAADAQHIAAELTGRFEVARPALAAIALTVDSSALTAIGNDDGFDRVFARQLEALGRPGDCLVAISTSGTSANVVAAVAAAAALGVHRVGLSGRDGGRLASDCECCITVPSAVTACFS